MIELEFNRIWRGEAVKLGYYDITWKVVKLCNNNVSGVLDLCFSELASCGQVWQKSLTVICERKEVGEVVQWQNKKMDAGQYVFIQWKHSQ